MSRYPTCSDLKCSASRASSAEPRDEVERLSRIRSRLADPDRLAVCGDDDCERDGAAGETTNARAAVALNKKSTQKPRALSPSSESTTPFPAVRVVSQFPEPPKFRELYNSRCTRRTPAVPSFTVRSAPAGEHTDAALARVCRALPTDDLTLGVRG